MHAIGHSWHRPGGRRRGVFRPVRPAGVLGRGGGRTCVAHRHAGGQHDGRGDAGKVGEQQSRDRATGGQETLSDDGRRGQIAPRVVKKEKPFAARFPTPQIVATRQYYSYWCIVVIIFRLVI